MRLWPIIFLPLGVTLMSNGMMLDGQKRYHEVTFLTSHNSYASKAYGYRYAQQSLSLSKQLELGVRGLMLDTYYDEKRSEVIVCHGKRFTSFIKKDKPESFVESLHEIKQFMDHDPKAIITIFLENYVTDLSLLDKDIEKSGLDNYTLKPKDWLASEHQGWPTLNWMVEHNKRLVIFNSNGESKYLFNQWQEVIENQYGTLRIKAASRERKESRAQGARKRYLYLLNLIPSLKYDFGDSFKPVNQQLLKELIRNTYDHGLGKSEICKGILPNFINVDFIEQGNPLELVNNINQFQKCP